MKFMFSKKHTPFLTLFFLVLMVSSTYAQMETTGNIAPLLTGRNVLAGSAHNDSPGSSDLTLIVQLKVDGNIVIDEGSSIKVIQPLQNIPSDADPTGWTQPDFDDSGWQDGTYGVGYGDGDDNTVIGDGDNATLYTRAVFDLANRSVISTLTLGVDYDDGCVIW